MVDKLILLSPRIDPRFKKIAERHGDRAAGYAYVVDLSKTKYRIPARLYYRGYYNGFHKLVFVSVAKLGFRQVFAERHYTVAEIATIWNLSKNAVRRLFAKEPGVLVLGHTQGRAHKRRYTTLRVPESVLARVHRKCSLLI